MYESIRIFEVLEILFVVLVILCLCGSGCIVVVLIDIGDELFILLVDILGIFYYKNFYVE